MGPPTSLHPTSPPVVTAVLVGWCHVPYWHPYLRAVDLRPIAGSRLPAGRDVVHDELDALLATCDADDRPAGIRDGAVIALAYLSGLRRGELAELQRW